MINRKRHLRLNVSKAEFSIFPPQTCSSFSPLCVCFVPQSYPTLCNLMNCSLPGSSVPEIFQARLLECVAIYSSRVSSQSSAQTHISCVSCIGSQVHHWGKWRPFSPLTFGKLPLTSSCSGLKKKKNHYGLTLDSSLASLCPIHEWIISLLPRAFPATSAIMVLT